MSLHKSGYQCSFSWVPNKGPKLPRTAFAISKDLYVARVLINNQHFIGKALQDSSAALVRVNSQEEKYSNFEVLCYTALRQLGKAYAWANCAKGIFPQMNKYLIAGRVSGVRPIYILRSLIGDEITMGWLYHGENFGRFLYEGKEVIKGEYDVLCYKDII